MDPNAVVEIFMGLNRIQATAFFGSPQGSKPERAPPDKLLEINLRGGSPQVADAILQNALFTLDGSTSRSYVMRLVTATLEQRTDTDDIKSHCWPCAATRSS